MQSIKQHQPRGRGQARPSVCCPDGAERGSLIDSSGSPWASSTCQPVCRSACQVRRLAFGISLFFFFCSQLTDRWEGNQGPRLAKAGRQNFFDARPNDDTNHHRFVSEGPMSAGRTSHGLRCFFGPKQSVARLFTLGSGTGPTPAFRIVVKRPSLRRCRRRAVWFTACAHHEGCEASRLEYNARRSRTHAPKSTGVCASVDLPCFGPLAPSIISPSVPIQAGNSHTRTLSPEPG